MKNQISILFFLLVSVWCSEAQQANDTVNRKNIIKVDLTSYWLYRNAIVFSYERVTKPNQTFAITAGYQQFPSFGFIDNVNVTDETSASGLKLGGEYRFYLKKENKYRAPRGVYIGPYLSFHNYSNDLNLEIDYEGILETVKFKTDLNILNLGVQLGYQFVLNNRWTIDLVFVGPSISNYIIKANLDGDGDYNFDPDDITNEVILALIDKFPAFEELINEGEVSGSGKLNTWGYGYRYQLQVGYHFGRKKK